VSDPVLKTLMDNSCRSAKANAPHSPDLRAHILSRTVDDRG
jgi:hypothetical protein